jgi:hypothetical protein
MCAAQYTVLRQLPAVGRMPDTKIYGQLADTFLGVSQQATGGVQSSKFKIQKRD